MAHCAGEGKPPAKFLWFDADLSVRGLSIAEVQLRMERSPIR